MYRYILNDHDEPVPCPDMQTWARWRIDNDQRRGVAKTCIGEVLVSTIFLCLDFQPGTGDPQLYETKVVGGALDDECDRYPTREAALAGHEAMVARVRAPYLL